MTPKVDIENGRWLVVSFVAWAVVAVLGSALASAYLEPNAAMIFYIAFYFLSFIGWGIGVGLYQTRLERRRTS